MQISRFIFHGRGAADKALATVGEIGTQYKVKLTTSTADMANASTLRIHLTKQIHVNRIIDGDKVIKVAKLGNNDELKIGNICIITT